MAFSKVTDQSVKNKAFLVVFSCEGHNSFKENLRRNITDIAKRKKQLDFGYDIFSHKQLRFIYVFVPFLLFFTGLAIWIWRKLRSSMCHLPDHWSLCLAPSTSF